MVDTSASYFPTTKTTFDPLLRFPAAAEVLRSCAAVPTPNPTTPSPFFSLRETDPRSAILRRFCT